MSIRSIIRRRRCKEHTMFDISFTNQIKIFSMFSAQTNSSSKIIKWVFVQHIPPLINDQIFLVIPKEIEKNGKVRTVTYKVNDKLSIAEPPRRFTKEGVTIRRGKSIKRRWFAPSVRVRIPKVEYCWKVTQTWMIIQFNLIESFRATHCHENWEPNNQKNQESHCFHTP